MLHLVFEEWFVAEKEGRFRPASLKFDLFVVSITIYILSKNHLGRFDCR